MKKLIAVFVCLWAGQLFAQGEVLGVRMWQAPDNTRLVFDLSGAVEHTLFTLHNPERIVIDLEQAKLKGKLPTLDFRQTAIKRIRTAARGAHDMRMVLDLKSAVQPKSFSLKPYEEYGHRLVIDLHQKSGKAEPKAKVVNSDRTRDVIIAIDAGHGGEDPGARGYKGTREKNVVLSIARRLAKLIRDEKGMRPVLVRNGDYYISLRDRMRIARRERADLFVSIHADAFHDKRAHGASVYTLSRRGASSEAARWLAESENAADLIGGVSLDDKDDLLASVLLDLSQTASMEASLDVADNVLKGLQRVGKVHKKRVQQAGFVVLKSPDIPSLLVETAFISNPTEEKNLRDKRYQWKLAGAIRDGLVNYFSKNPPAGTRMVRRHVIQRGDTLSALAERYQVSSRELKQVNKLSGNSLRIGEVLRIPHTGG